MMDDAFERYDAEQYQKIRKRPVCMECGEHIVDEYYEFTIRRITFRVCPDCLKDFRKYVEED